MNAERFPHLRALLDGHLVIYAVEEWPLVRVELRTFVAEFESLRDYSIMLIEKSGGDVSRARELIDAVLSPKKETPP